MKRFDDLPGSNAAPPFVPADERGPGTVGVRYGAMNWVGQFNAPAGVARATGGKVVVQTERGIELGEQLPLTCSTCGKAVNREQVKRYVDESGPEFYRWRAGRVLRLATPEDLNEHQRLNADVVRDIAAGDEIAARLQLDMQFVTAEHLLGGERIVFYFRSETRVDFRQLVRELAQRYQTRIEMRQVGARDEARLVADWEVCGRECCCKSFLKKLRPVSMKMAKIQKSTLDPSKVSGRCGRLRCCLRYEHDGYEELLKSLPRRNTRVLTVAGVGRVVDHQVLTQLVLVRLEDEREMAFPLEEIRVLAEGEEVPADALPPAAAGRPGPAGPEPQRDGDRRGRDRFRRPRDGRSAPPSREGPRPRADAAPPTPPAAAPPTAPPAGADTGETPPDAAPRPSGSRRGRRRRRRRDSGGGSGGSSGGGDAPPPAAPE